jgi:hypothetical protein
MFGTHFVPPHKARTIFEHAASKGYSATSFFWPATFPARPESPVQTIPGLGTPDIQGRLGVGILFSTDPNLKDEKYKTQVETLEKKGPSSFTGQLMGPGKKKAAEVQTSALPFTLDFQSGQQATLKIGAYEIQLANGVWSPILELSFKLGFLFHIKVLTQVILTQSEPDPRLYFLPLQIHPLKSPWRYGASGGFVKRTWKAAGPFLTLGWPQDTTALDEGWIDDNQFLALCESIQDSRERVFQHQLKDFKEGVLGVVFDTLDRVQHMFWKDHQDIVAKWYQRLDSFIGNTKVQLEGKGKHRLLIVSDHGFCNFDYKVNLNRWLIDQDYLKLNQSSVEQNERHSLKEVDWSKSKAYAVGLNSLYINLAGREGQGSVTPDQAAPLQNMISDDLLAWRGPDGRKVVGRIYLQDKVLDGSRAESGPDFLIGYNPGYRASSETGLGGWREHQIDTNRDHWGADHCIDPQAVPGVLFTSFRLDGNSVPSYRDFPSLAIDTDLEQPIQEAAPPSASGDEDQAAVEERLKGLGYL